MKRLLLTLLALTLALAWLWPLLISCIDLACWFVRDRMCIAASWDFSRAVVLMFWLIFATPTLGFACFKVAEASHAG